MLISSPRPTQMLHFGQFALPCSSTGVQGEISFRHPGINGRMHLLQAYRSLPRPSSLIKPSHPPTGVFAPVYDLKLALTLVILQVLRELQYLQCATSLSIRKNFLLIRANLLVPLHDGHCKFSLTKSFISPIFHGEIAYLELWLHTPLHIGIRPLF